MQFQAKTSLVAKQFSADFSEITLTQLDNPDPLIINGVGTINQDERGLLQLKVFQQKSLDNKKVFHYRGEKAGGKISSTGACSLRATEFGGGEWVCDYLKTTESIFLDSHTCTGVFFAEVEKIESCHGTPFGLQESSFEGIIPFELDLPYNLGANGKRNSYPSHMIKLVFNKTTKIEILRCERYTSVKIINKFELISERFVEALTQALSIATGRTIKFIWRQLIGDSYQHRMISEFDFELSRTKLRPPLDSRYDAHFSKFLEFYIRFSLQNDHNYFGYWEKLHASWASGLVVAALPLSVYVEGVLREFYPELLKVDPKLQDEVDLTISVIDGLPDLDRAIKERFRNRIRGAARGTVTTGLRALSERGSIDKKLVTSWQSVRNRSAHGDDFTQEQVTKIQKLVSQIFSCLHLFYVLLYLKLGFFGYVVDYSTIGFPSVFWSRDRGKLKPKKQGKGHV